MHLYMLTPLYSIEILQVSALEGPSLGSTDMFCEQGQQNTCPDVNIRLRNSIWYVTWQKPNVTTNILCIIYNNKFIVPTR